MPVLLIGCRELVLKKVVQRTNPSKRRKKSTEFFYGVSYLLSTLLSQGWYYCIQTSCGPSKGHLFHLRFPGEQLLSEGGNYMGFQGSSCCLRVETVCGQTLIDNR